MHASAWRTVLRHRGGRTKQHLADSRRFSLLTSWPTTAQSGTLSLQRQFQTHQRSCCKCRCQHQRALLRWVGSHVPCFKQLLRFSLHCPTLSHVNWGRQRTQKLPLSSQRLSERPNGNVVLHHRGISQEHDSDLPSRKHSEAPAGHWRENGPSRENS